MINRFYFFICLGLLVLLCFNVSSQDLIVLQSGDSINCKIIGYEGKRIKFKHNRNGEIKTSVISKEQLIYKKHNFYSTTLDDSTNTPDFGLIRVSLSGGFSQIIAPVGSSVSEQLIDYANELRSGNHLGGSLLFFGHKNLGVGVTYKAFQTSNRIEGYITEINENLVTGNVEDDMLIQHFGMLLGTKTKSERKKIIAFGSLGIGLVSYQNNQTFIDRYLIKGSSFSIISEFQVDFKLYKQIYLGVGFEILFASLTHAEITRLKDNRTVNFSFEENLDEKFGLSRMDLGAGIKWHLFNKTD